MSAKLVDDINRCLSKTDFTNTKEAQATFVFDEKFLGFQGHFEGNPVLPGVCKIIAAREVIKSWKKNNELELKEINSAKFFMPVTVNEELVFHCVDNEKAGCLFITVKILKGETKVSELKLKF